MKQNTASASFSGPGGRSYTYITDLDLKEGDICIVKAPKGYAAVTITAVPAVVPVDPMAKFEYKKITLKVIEYPDKLSDGTIVSRAYVVGTEMIATANSPTNAIAALLKLVSDANL